MRETEPGKPGRELRPPEPGRKWLDRLARLDFSYFFALLGESTLAITFVFYVLIARAVGPGPYGMFSAAVALGGILGVLIQFGLPVLLTRNVAADPGEGTRQTRQFIAIQLVHTVPVLLILPLLIHLMGFSRQGAALCYLMVFAELCRSVKMLWRSIMKGNSWFHLESLSVFAERLFSALLAGTVLFTTGSLVLTTAALVFARIVDNVVTGVCLGRRFQLTADRQTPAWTETWRRALPFALHGLLWVLYYQVDMIMLKAMAPEVEVGYYGAAYRVLEIFAALPRVVFYVAFTRFAQCHVQDPARMPGHIYRAARVLLLLVLPALLAAGFLQPLLVPFLFGNAYLASVGLLAVLLPGLAVKMFGSLNEEYLLATGAEKKLPPLMLAVALSNISANLLLIPRFGAMGAAVATGISECVFFSLGLRLLLKSPVRRAARQLVLIAFPSVLIALAPSLAVAGASVGLVSALVAGGILAVIAMMRPRFFGR